MSRHSLAIAAGTLTYTHDANGNLTGSSAGLALAYNAKDQTTSVTPPAGTALAMTYTGASQVQRVMAGGDGFTHSLLGLSSKTDSGGTAYYTRDAGGTLVGQRLGSNRYYYLFDGLGSVVAMTDSSGNVTNRYAYDPYGGTTRLSGTVANPWRFGGSYGAYTDGTGLVKIGQRFYDPGLGRWTQRDPLGVGNPYAYTDCNPANQTAQSTSASLCLD